MPKTFDGLSSSGLIVVPVGSLVSLASDGAKRTWQATRCPAGSSAVLAKFSPAATPFIPDRQGAYVLEVKEEKETRAFVAIGVDPRLFTVEDGAGGKVTADHLLRLLLQTSWSIDSMVATIEGERTVANFYGWSTALIGGNSDTPIGWSHFAKDWR